MIQIEQACALQVLQTLTIRFCYESLSVYLVEHWPSLVVRVYAFLVIGLFTNVLQEWVKVSHHIPSSSINPLLLHR